MPRFRCQNCRRTFSQQTFAFSYYLKRAELSEPIAAGLHAGSAHRQLARSFGCAAGTVTRRAARLGRHGLLLLARALEALPRIDEPIVYDDFETFELSQDLPFGIGTAVGQRSWFLYGLDQARHRRGGRLSPAQRARPRHRTKEPRGSYRRAFTRTVERLLAGPAGSSRLRVITDDHVGYRAAARSRALRGRIEHRVFPNPRRAYKHAPRDPHARRRDRQMFAVDLLHGLMRHSLAHHRRETIAFGRRVNALLERGFLMAIWRNFVKGRSERKPDRSTPAMMLRLTDRPWSWARVLAARLFPWKVRVCAEWMRIYRRELLTPQLGPNTAHALRNAF